MKKINRNVALIEYGGSHTECMFTQIEALRNKDYNVFLVCNKSLIKNFNDLSVFSDILLLHDVYDKLTISEKFEDIRRLNKFVNKHRIDTAVINTLEHKMVKYLLLYSMFRIKNYIAIVHNGAYIKESGTFKKLYTRVKKVFVLSDNIVKKIGGLPREILLTSFYPIYFPAFNDYRLEKPQNEFWFTIPGALVATHRDIIHLFDKLETECLPGYIKIILLGPMEDAVRNRLKHVMEKGNANFVSFEGRVPQDIFNAYMSQTDVVLPLVMSDFYGDYRISGTYNLAYSYQKPMLLEKEIQKSNYDFNGISIPYERSNIVNALKSISVNKELLKECKSAYENHPYLTVEKQFDKFIEILEK